MVPRSPALLAALFCALAGLPFLLLPHSHPPTRAALSGLLNEEDVEIIAITEPELIWRPARRRRAAVDLPQDFPPGDYALYALPHVFPGEERLLLNLTALPGVSGLIVETIQGNLSWMDRELDPEPCLYQGTVLGDPTSHTVLNLCKGMFGSLFMRNDTYFIEPLESRDLGHVLYKYRSNSFQPQPDLEVADVVEEEPSPSVRSKRMVGQPLGVFSRDYYVEVLVVADANMFRYHGHNVKDYVLTLMSIVRSLYRHPSLEASVHIVVVKLIVFEIDSDDLLVVEDAAATLNNFCRWQHRHNDFSDSSLDHHDVAILLTKKDICRAKDKCDTLGLAELGTLCDERRSCAIIEDNGLSAAFTIAHELGHLFNMPHDDEKKCSQYMSLHSDSGELMAPTLAHNTKPFSWSPCSARILEKFLDNNRKISCLHDKPSQLSYTAKMDNLPSPGINFDANAQCMFVFGPSSTICSFNMPTCKRLWCTVMLVNGPACRTIHIPWADGTPCARDRWCYQGHCVGFSPKQMQPVHGGWGEWSGFSECSRTCGGGIMRAYRKCDNPMPRFGGDYCTGMRIKWSACNVRDCDPNGPDFRQVQCTKFDGRPTPIYNLHTDVNWVPKYTKVNEHERCALWCEVKGSSNLYFKLKDKVTDGTPCDRYSDDMCIDGQCVKSGCDHRPLSTLQRDKCGVCGGNGSSCIPVKGVINERKGYGSFLAFFHDLVAGYNMVLKIPSGSAQIDIRQRGTSESDDNYLAIQNSKREFILNGDFQINPTLQEIPIKGGIIFYSGSNNSVERINSTRLIGEDIYIYVLSIGRLIPPNIHYEYLVSKTYGRVPTLPRYLWQATTEWSSCSLPCQGEQKRVINCIDTETERQVDDRRCRNQRQPEPEVKACHTHCQIKWEVRDASPCSAHCGSGHKRQEVHCAMTSGPDHRAVDERYCGHLQKPPQTVPCYHDCAGRKWVYSEWSPCHVTCGGGTQSRSRFCVDGSNVRLDESHCQRQTQEATSKPCNVLPCPTWVYGHWGECSKSCDGGVKIRPSICQDVEGRTVNKHLCDEQKRMDQQQCNTHLCTYWHYGEWGPCSQTCDRGIATRSAVCRDSRRNTLEQSECDIRTRAVSKPCEVQPCPRWKIEEWSRCSATCSEGWKYRKVACIDGAGRQVDKESCKKSPSEPPPPSHMVCNLGSCPFWRASDWTRCSVSCGSGEESRNLECVYGRRVVDDAFCPSDRRPDVRRTCSLFRCPEWEVGPWNECSVTCGSGVERRHVFCHHPDSKVRTQDTDCGGNRPRDFRGCQLAECRVHVTPAPTEPTTVIRQVLRDDNEASRQRAHDPRVSYRWDAGAYGACSTSCGRGTQRRLVACRDRHGRVLTHAYCRHLTKPRDTRYCTSSRCPVPRTATVYSWRTGAWQECDKSCGAGKQRRQVVCYDSPFPRVLPPLYCDPTSRPAARRWCNTHRCPNPSRRRPGNSSDHRPRHSNRNRGPSRQRLSDRRVWRSGRWTQCSKTCGKGVRRREIWCTDAAGVILDFAQCDTATRPIGEHNCRVAKCPQWNKGQWSPCSVTCGNGSKTRSVSCDADEGCPEPKPDDRAACTMEPCPSYFWVYTKWSECSKSCGLGVQHREVRCVNNHRQAAPGRLCPRHPRPSSVRQCLRTQCLYEWQAGPWSSCSRTCDKGVQYRELHCRLKTVNRTLLVGAEIPERHCALLPRIPSRRICNHGPCSSHFFWQMGQWSQCSSTCGPGIQRRRIRCMNRSQRRVRRQHCSRKLRPKRKRDCFERNCVPSDCMELKLQEKTDKDGLYDLFVKGKVTKIYCAKMNESTPRAYLPLASGQAGNFAEIYSKRLHYPFTCPNEGRRNESCLCTDHGHPNAGLTHFDKLRVDLYNLKIDTEDFAFASTMYGNPVPYASAGDCYSAVNCPQGRFRIDLRDTGFKVSQKTIWREQGHRSSHQIKIFSDGQVVAGLCGGYCGRCFPDKLIGLLLDLKDLVKV